LHRVAGWSPADGEYRATVADVYGHAEVMAAGSSATAWCSSPWGDPPVRIRLTWELEGSGILWRNQMSVAGGPWSFVKEYVCTPVS
jgi:hypothetical protein